MSLFVRRQALLVFFSLALQASKTSFGHAASSDEVCLPISELGTPSLDDFQGSIKLEITDEDEDCDFELSLEFTHDSNQPVAESLSDCAPDVIGSDGKSLLAMRWYYESVPDYIKAATGVDHISIDWNPCGHPPVEAFGVAHYDIHVYRVTPEFRTCMTCDMASYAPICDPAAQSSRSGNSFFTYATSSLGSAGELSNLPSGFSVDATAAVPLMGSHAWNFANQPNSTDGRPWTEPVWIMGPYDGGIVDYEPMFPLSFIQGDTNKAHTEKLTYVGQTIRELPRSYSVFYDAETEVATVTFTGKSSLCGAAYADAKKSKSGKKGKSGKNKRDGKSSSSLRNGDF